jgi:hypothetical protein
MTYCLYKTSHPSGKFYVGKGLTASVVGGKYKGSGVLLGKYFKKYPKQEWLTEVLSVYEDELLAYAAEETYVNEDLLLNENCLNLVPGGHGWTRAQVIKHNAEMWANPEYRIKMSKMKAAHWLDENFVAKIKLAASKFQSEKWKDPVYKEKMTAVSRETVKKTWKNPEFQSSMGKRAWAKPGFREQQLALGKDRAENGSFLEYMAEGREKFWVDAEKTAPTRKKYSDRIKNMRWMNRDGIAKQIPLDQIDMFAAQGWNRGMKC